MMANNYYNNDQEDNRSYQKTVAMCVAAASLVILLFLVILYVNSDNTDTKPSADMVTEKETEEEEFLDNTHNITSDELDFWKDSAKPKPTAAPAEEEGELTPYRDPASEKDDKTGDGTSDETKKRDDGDNEGSLNKDSDEEHDRDKYVAITDSNGKKKLYEILKDVPKNDYDLENGLINENGILSYKDGKREAVKGVDLSKYNGAVDFNRLKDAGIGFAMLRLGSRGYGTGKIDLDDKFVEYAQNAQLAGIQTGAYFYSQAINETEAVEEANYIVGAVSGFKIKFPIAIDIEKVEGDEARTDKLTNDERTAVVKSFCETVKGYGYKPIIHASKDILVAGLNLEELADYDVWLADEEIPTEYPYRFSMWQYNRKGHIEGITGDIALNLSFINYEQR